MSVAEVIDRLREIEVRRSTLERRRLLRAPLPRGDGRRRPAARRAHVPGQRLRRGARPQLRRPLLHRATTPSPRDPSKTPRAWLPLFERRARRDIAPLQFAVAGMNAHINRDLPVALVDTCRALGLDLRDGSPEHADYRARQRPAREGRVARQAVVSHRLDEARRPAAAPGRGTSTTSSRCGTSRVRVTQPGRTAWRSGTYAASPTLAAQFLLTLDRMVGLAGRGFLIPADSLLQKLGRHLTL